MKPYGLRKKDCSQRPHCPCCTTKYHGAFSGHTKNKAKKISKKRARQANKKITTFDQD